MGFGDETWWTRVRHRALNTWVDEPVRLVEQSVAKDDPDPKALACYGLLVPESDELWLRFVDGRPASGITGQFLSDCCTKLAARGKSALLLIWDNASWYISRVVKGWIGAHNRQVKQDGCRVRIIACQLLIKAPSLNPIEPEWVHGKRVVVEPAGCSPPLSWRSASAPTLAVIPRSTSLHTKPHDHALRACPVSLRKSARELFGQ